MRPSIPGGLRAMALAALSMLVGLGAVGAGAAVAAEIIPSVGVTRAAEGDDAEVFGGLAFRAPIVDNLLDTEIGVAYRSESRFGDQLDVRMWPVTGSLWLSPIPNLYAGGGVGWYHTTLDWNDEIPVDDDTSQEFGVHLGGGLEVPLAEPIGLDLHGRYVFLREEEQDAFPESFDPDFWQTSLGLKIAF